MRFLYFLFAIALAPTFGQQADVLLFNEKTHDFGVVAEKGGSVATEFTFINNSGRTIKILNVVPSCGCTTPNWSKEPIAHGKQGFIKATFDPRGKGGYFNKSIAVTTDYDGKAINLQITGTVEELGARSGSVGFDSQNGALWTKVSTFHLGKIFNNKENTVRTFDLLNKGKTVLHISEVKTPAYIAVKFPETLKPNELGVLQITYDGRAKNEYGFSSDNIELITNDAENPTKAFTVFAQLEEFFPTLTPEILQEAPVLRMDNPDIKFGEMLESATLQYEVVIRNGGKSDLKIRSLQPNCSCLKAQVETETLRPGQASKIKITLTPKGRPGVQNKSIAVYSNDPKSPIQRITVSGNVR